MFSYQTGQFPVYSIPKVLPTSTPKNTAIEGKKNRSHTQSSLLPLEEVLVKIQSLNSNLMSFRPQHKSVSLTTQFLKSNGNGNFDGLAGR